MKTSLWNAHAKLKSADLLKVSTTTTYSTPISFLISLIIEALDFYSLYIHWKKWLPKNVQHVVTSKLTDFIKIKIVFNI